MRTRVHLPFLFISAPPSLHNSGWNCPTPHLSFPTGSWATWGHCAPVVQFKAMSHKGKGLNGQGFSSHQISHSCQLGSTGSLSKSQRSTYHPRLLGDKYIRVFSTFPVAMNTCPHKQSPHSEGKDWLAPIWVRTSITDYVLLGWSLSESRKMLWKWGGGELFLPPSGKVVANNIFF